MSSAKSKDRHAATASTAAVAAFISATPTDPFPIEAIELYSPVGVHEGPAVRPMSRLRRTEGWALKFETPFVTARRGPDVFGFPLSSIRVLQWAVKP